MEVAINSLNGPFLPITGFEDGTWEIQIDELNPGQWNQFRVFARHIEGDTCEPAKAHTKVFYEPNILCEASVTDLAVNQEDGLVISTEQLTLDGQVA